MISSPRVSAGATSFTVLDGTAKPMPTLPCEPPVSICEFTPITCPAALSSGPPELPGLIGASVWITESIEKPLGARISRPTPETMPSVAVRSRPKGLPIAIAVSPTRTERESARLQRLDPARDVAGVDLHEREIARRVGAAHLAVDGLAVGSELDLDAVAVADHVGVRDDPAVAGDQEAGAGAVARADRDDGGARVRVYGAGLRLACFARERRGGLGQRRAVVAVPVPVCPHPGCECPGCEHAPPPGRRRRTRACGAKVRCVGAGAWPAIGVVGASSASRTGRPLAAARRAASDCARQSPVHSFSGRFRMQRMEARLP